MRRPGGAERVPWLDGVRGGAALFVVLHHIWLTSWPAFPRDTGPWWLGWLLYGHLAVAVFIVVSGFSLALAPMRNHGRLTGSVAHFLNRRAWRIIPPYWAALLLSVLIAGLYLQPSLSAEALGKSLAVHGLLLQDVVGSATPNGALWSIAVEWQIYFVFPVLLLLGRWFGMPLAVLLAGVVVLGAHALASTGPPLDAINQLMPQFLLLFSLGVLAVRLGRGDRAAARRRPLGALAAACFAAFVVLALAQGSEWMVARFFWVDLLFGMGVASLLAVAYAGGVAPLRRVLASRIALWLGLFSYSIYLIHDPLVGVLNQAVVDPLDLAPLAAFGLMIVAGLPVILACSYGFHLVFEAPFVGRRGWSALRAMPLVRRLSTDRRVADPGARPASFPPPLPVPGEPSAGLDDAAGGRLPAEALGPATR